MENSILTSTKKILGIPDEYRAFDQDVLTHINTALGVLNQLGVGPGESFFVEDENAVWTDFMVAGSYQNMVRTYVWLKVRMLFDPPATSFLQQNMTEQIREIEWRLQAREETQP